MSTGYRPGVCNIGRGERRVRYAIGAVGFATAAAVVGAVALLSLPDWWLLLTVLPLFGGFVGYYQGREAFCVRFAMQGVYNVSDALGGRMAVPDDEAVRRDRRRARRLVGRSAVAAIAVAIAAFLAVPALAG